jgi:single-stranded-DNA-specific exonuclease
MPDKAWKMMPAPPPGFDRVLGLSPFQAHLAYNRGIKSRRDLEGFLNPGLWPWHDPMLLPDMAQAVERLTRAVKAGEVIGVFGDFDTDGVTGTALLVL